MLPGGGLLAAALPGSAQEPSSSTPGFRALDAEGVRGYLAADPELAQRVGPEGSEADWQVRMTA